MKWPTVRRMKEQQTLHIEAEGCIVNIRQGLTDRLGRSVTSVQIIPDKDRYDGYWKLAGSLNNRIIKLKGKKK